MLESLAKKMGPGQLSQGLGEIGSCKIAGVHPLFTNLDSCGPSNVQVVALQDKKGVMKPTKHSTMSIGNIL